MKPLIINYICFFSILQDMLRCTFIEHSSWWHGGRIEEVEKKEEEISHLEALNQAVGL